MSNRVQPPSSGSFSEPENPESPDTVRPKKPDLPPFAPPLEDKEDPRRKEMLRQFEEDFGSYTPKGGTSSGVSVECPPRVTIGIQESPSTAILAAGGQTTLHANNRQPLEGGVLTWRVLQGAASLQLPPGLHGMTLAVTGTLGGSALVDIEHTYQGQTARAQCTVHVVGVTIQEAPYLARPHPGGGNPLNLTLHAQGTPGPGVYGWQNQNANVADWQGGPPGNVAAPTLVSGAAGTSVVTASYTAHGVIAQATVTVGLVTVAWAEAPGRALVLPAANAPAASLTLHAQGTPAGGAYGWARPTPSIVRFAGNAVNGNPVSIDAETVDAGSGRLAVTYSWNGAQARAEIGVDVVEVTIRQGAEVALALHGVGAQRNAVHIEARGHPGGGDYAWQILNGQSARFQGGNLPGNTDQVDLESNQAGTTQFEVAYRHGPVGHEVTARATLRVHVVSLTLTEAPGRALVLPGPQQPANTFVLHAVGLPAHPAGEYGYSRNNAQIAALQDPDPQHPDQITVETGGTAGQSNVGAEYRLLGASARATLTVDVVQVEIQEGAERAILMHAGGQRNALALNARGTPGGGNFAWQVTVGNAVRFQGGNLPGNNAQVTVESDQAGTATVRVRYTAGPGGHQATAEATIQIHVVAVSITQAPAGGNNAQILAVAPAVGGHGWNRQRGATLQLDAVGLPADGRGQYDWHAYHAGRVRFQGGNPPGNNAQATVETRDRGNPAGFRVRYTLLGVTAEARGLVEQMAHCSQIQWTPAVNPPVAGANAVVAQAAAACPDEAARQRPHGAAGGALTGLVRVLPQRALRRTPAADHPHHHGGVCPRCSQAQHGLVYHWIDPDNAGNGAALAALELRNQIHQCVARWDGAGGNTANRRGNVNAWVQQLARGWNWLVNVDFDAFRLPPMWSPRDARPKMFGVLLGTNQAGQQVKLRAISGSFPYRNTEQPNQYWSPGLPNRLQIPSATRGTRNYPAYPNHNFVGLTFGTCAASKLLSHALRLGLSIDSMAEIWIGEDAHGRQDAALQASCDSCRRYIGEMLCEAGGNARTDVYPNAVVGVHRGLPPNRGLA